MRNILIITALLISINLFADSWDTIIKLNGETIECEIVKIDDDNVTFKYKGETLVNSISLNVVNKIEYKSGRIQNVNKKVVINGEQDWEKVVITKDAEDVEGLVRGEQMTAKASSAWEYSNQGKQQKKAMNKIRKEAASKGYHIVYILTEAGKNGNMWGGARSSFTVVGYSYE